MYALNALKKARDISFSRNLPGIMTNVGPAPGPDGRRGTSYEFLWRKKSFIYFPNNEKLDSKNSITILACLQVYKVGLMLARYCGDETDVSLKVTGLPRF